MGILVIKCHAVHDHLFHPFWSFLRRKNYSKLPVMNCQVGIVQRAPCCLRHVMGTEVQKGWIIYLFLFVVHHECFRMEDWAILRDALKLVEWLSSELRVRPELVMEPNTICTVYAQVRRSYIFFSWKDNLEIIINVIVIDDFVRKSHMEVLKERWCQFSHWGGQTRNWFLLRSGVVLVTYLIRLSRNSFKTFNAILPKLFSCKLTFNRCN
jgi:hypothetical protein